MKNPQENNFLSDKDTPNVIYYADEIDEVVII